MIYRLTKPRLMTILGCSLYTLILWWVYAPVMAFTKIFYYHLDIEQDVFCFLLAISPSLFLPIEVTKPSHFICWLLYITVAAPSAFVAPHILGSRSDVWPFAIAVVLSLIAIIPASNWKPLKMPRLALTPFQFWMVMAGFSVLAFIAMYGAYGMPNTSISFASAEGLRAAFKDKNQDAPMLVRYFFRWEGNVVAPLCVAYGLTHRNWLLLAIGCGLEQLLFMFTTLRQFDLIPLMQVAIFFWISRKQGQSGPKFIFGVTAMCLLFSYLLLRDDHFLLGLAFFERFLLVGGQHTAFYYEYFTSHKPAMLGASYGQHLFNAPYDRAVGLIIGNAYYRQGGMNDGTNATAHFLAQGYANFRWVGLVVSVFACRFVLWIIDSSYTRVDKRISVPMTIMIALSLAATGLDTSILTGGILPMIIVGLIGGRILHAVPAKNDTAVVQGDISSQPALATESST